MTSLLSHNWLHLHSYQRPIALIDIDGVLINNSERQAKHFNAVTDGVPHVKHKLTELEWEAYEADAHLDKPTGFIQTVKAFSPLFSIVLLTARPYTKYESTVAALDNFGLSPAIYDIRMRSKLEQSSVQFKTEAVETLLQEGRQIAFAVDDERQIIDMYVSKNIPALRMYNTLDTDHPRYYY